MVNQLPWNFHGKQISVFVFLASIIATLSDGVAAQFNPQQLEPKSVRVVATKNVTRNGKPYAISKAASGFLWQTQTDVITSLHAVPAGYSVTATCRGVSKRVRVLKVYEQADLVLLRSKDGPLNCEKFSNYDPKSPTPGASLWTYGFHAGAKSGTSRRFEKGHAQLETISNLVTGKTLKLLSQFQIPSTTLSIYYVQGGLLPGYSGAPVVNQQGHLIGIVDGGLNEGQDGYNWVVPASNIKRLMASTVTRVPAKVERLGQQLFSSGVVKALPSTVLAYKQGGRSYRWVKTKTLSISDLVATAADVGIIDFINAFAPAAGFTDTKEFNHWEFDIYEEQRHGLILAVPARQILKFGPTSKGGSANLHSNLSNAGGSTTLYYYHFKGSIRLDSNPFEKIHAVNRSFLNELYSRNIATCTKPGRWRCNSIFEPSILDFGQNQYILNMATSEVFEGRQEFRSVQYKSYAIKSGLQFSAIATIYPSGSSGLLQCYEFKSKAACSTPRVAKQQLAQLVAAHLTSFSRLSSAKSQNIKRSAVKYDGRHDHPDTFYKPYLENGEIRFFNVRGNRWKFYPSDGSVEIFGEIQRDQERGFVYLKHIPLANGKKYGRYAIPIAGGDYHYSRNDKKFEKVGSLKRQE